MVMGLTASCIWAAFGLVSWGDNAYGRAASAAEGGYLVSVFTIAPAKDPSYVHLLADEALSGLQPMHLALVALLLLFALAHLSRFVMSKSTQNQKMVAVGFCILAVVCASYYGNLIASTGPL
jgi:hypothetical protein